MTVCLFTEPMWQWVSTGTGDQFSALLVFLMALQLVLVDRNLFWPCCLRTFMNCILLQCPTDGIAAHACRLKDFSTLFLGGYVTSTIGLTVCMSIPVFEILIFSKCLQWYEEQRLDFGGDSGFWNF